MRLSIIIPIYNEYNSIDGVIEKIRSVSLPGEIRDVELILIDDGSSDGTAARLEKYKQDATVVVHQSRVNFGKGAATRIGLTYVTGDIVLIQDADFEYDPADYPNLLRPIIDQGAQVVYGSRFYFSKKKLEGMAFKNWVMNRFLTTLTNILYRSSLSDEATAYKMFKREILLDMKLRSNRFEICPELTAKILKKGIAIVEVPISYRGRTVEEGKKIRWFDAVEAVVALVKYRFVN